MSVRGPFGRRRGAAITGDGLARAVRALAECENWDDEELRGELVAARRDLQTAGAREQSLVRGIYLRTHRRYKAAADHLVVHFAQFPADEIAGSMLVAFDLAGPLAYRHYGRHLAEQQYALAGPESWPWASWLAATRAEQARPDYADVLAPVAAALAHLTAGRPGHAVGLLTALGEKSERIGGVCVEREIIQDTLARSLIDAGQPERATQLLHHRRSARQHHTYEDLLLAHAAPATA